jgi:hypothetical protein
MKSYIKYVGLSIFVSLFLFFLFGITTALLKTKYYMRMIPNTALDYFFLISSSILLGIYVGVHYYKKNNVNQCNTIATTGGIGSFFAFACPVCNKLLIFLFGATALMTYFEPYRPALGFASIGLLVGAIYWRLKQ